MDNNTIWIITICFGAAAVGVCSWSRFDEPSYDSRSEYFARYKPRFSTSYARYARAKWGYVWALISVYFVFSLIPEYVNAVRSGPKLIESSSIPMAVALGIITLQNVPGLNDLERQIRGFLHSFARIPEGIRRTVAQMRGSQFSFDPNAVVLQTRKMGLKNGSSPKPGTLSKLIVEDDILHGWYSIGCLLFALSEPFQGKIGIDPLFFDYYKDELDSINARHVALAEPVRQHLATPINGSSRRSFAADHDDAAVLRDIRDLRDRLYTFVACGVNSSIKTDAERFEILKRLGFTLDRSLDKVVMGLIGAADHSRSDPIYLHRLFDAVVPRVRAATSWSRLDRRVSDPGGDHQTLLMVVVNGRVLHRGYHGSSLGSKYTSC